jgi:hypothetical protein
MLQILIRGSLAAIILFCAIAPSRGQDADTVRNVFLRNRTVAFYADVEHFISRLGDAAGDPGIAVRFGELGELRFVAGYDWLNDGQWSGWDQRSRALNLEVGYFRYAVVEETYAFIYGADLFAGFYYPSRLLIGKIPRALTLANARLEAELSAGVAYAPISLFQFVAEYRFGYSSLRTSDMTHTFVSEARFVSHVRLSAQIALW